MGVTTQRYVRKPLYVDAVRVTTSNFEEIAQWCQGEITKEVRGSGAPKPCIRVRVQFPKNPRQTLAFLGDWILYTERGYKVYTNKAFRQAFDLVEETAENRPGLEAAPATLAPGPGEAPTPEADAAGGPGSRVERIEERAAKEPQEDGLPREIVDHTPQGEPHEIEATPETIAEEMRRNTEERERVAAEAAGNGVAVENSPSAPPDPLTPPEVAPRPEPVSEQPPEVAAAGKQVLSEAEQQRMGPDRVRELVTSGEAVLAQDLAS